MIEILKIAVISLYFLIQLILGTITMLPAINKEAQRENESIFENNRNNRNTARCVVNYDDEELLILSVQERRPLWDYTIPLEQRSQRLIKKLWDEVSETLGGKKTLKTFAA